MLKKLVKYNLPGFSSYEVLRYHVSLINELTSVLRVDNLFTYQQFVAEFRFGWLINASSLLFFLTRLKKK